MDYLAKEQFRQDVIDRFYSKFTCGPEDTCWMWQGQKDKDGYGKFNYRTKDRRYYLRAHRVMMALQGFIVPKIK